MKWVWLSMSVPTEEDAATRTMTSAQRKQTKVLKRLLQSPSNFVSYSFSVTTAPHAQRISFLDWSSLSKKRMITGAYRNIYRVDTKHRVLVPKVVPFSIISLSEDGTVGVGFLQQTNPNFNRCYAQNLFRIIF